MRRLLILALCSSCLAQTQGNLPTAVQALPQDASAIGGAVRLKHVVAGTVLFACQTRGFGSNASALTISDTLSSSWTLSSVLNIPDTSAGVPGTIQAGWAIAAGTGTDDITFTSTSGGQVANSVANFSGVTAADGSFGSNTGSGFPASISASTTTAVNGDLVAACTGSGNSVWMAPATPAQMAGSGASGTDHVISFLNAGAAGSYSITSIQNTGYTNINNAVGELIQAFSPAAITITDTLLPDADKTQAYSATIHSIGGTGTYACTLQAGSLPTGLSLSGTGNCTISGTVTGAVGNYPITIRSTESGGSTHVDSSGLSIKVGASFGTPAIIQKAILTTTTAPTLTFPNPVVNGDAILVVEYGWGRHAGAPDGGMGFILPADGVGGSLTDSLGTVFVRGGPIAAGDRPITYFLGCATSSGSDTVVFTDNQTGGSSSNIGEFILELSNTQPVLDFGVLKNDKGASSSPFTITSPSLTVPVSNESLFAVTSQLDGSGGSLVPTAPFSDLGRTGVNAGQDVIELADSLGVASGTTTATNTISSTIPKGEYNAMLLFGLRPEISGLPCGGTPVGTATIRHKVELF